MNFLDLLILEFDCILIGFVLLIVIKILLYLFDFCVKVGKFRFFFGRSGGGGGGLWWLFLWIFFLFLLEYGGWLFKGNFCFLKLEWILLLLLLYWL